MRAEKLSERDQKEKGTSPEPRTLADDSTRDASGDAWPSKNV